MITQEKLQESPLGVKKENDRNIANVISSEPDSKSTAPSTPTKVVLRTPTKKIDSHMDLPECHVRLMKGVIQSPGKLKLNNYEDYKNQFPVGLEQESMSDIEDAESLRSEKRKRSVSNGSVDTDRPPQKKAHVSGDRHMYDSLRGLATASGVKRRLGVRGGNCLLKRCNFFRVQCNAQQLDSLDSCTLD